MSDVLLRADAIAGQDRSRDYGHPKENHQRIAWLWNAWMQCHDFDCRLQASHVAELMVLLKLAREANTHKDDNIVDAAGYLKCLAMILDADTCNRNGQNGPRSDDPPKVFDSRKYGD